MKKLCLILISGLLSVLVLVGCEKTTTAAPTAVASANGLPDLPRNSSGFTDLSVEQLASSMASKNFTLVNVHVPDQGNLPGTDLSIPFDQITNRLDQLPGKDAPIVLYCRSGSMSTQAATALAAAGYSKVYELDGGFNAWKATGRELLGQQ
ncbi:MAG: rhodanese-like domain-containing protein [Burkholderiaceae bacterium]|nr:rhodanese-like domain-containing protein [Burkholderiaceae bacterium]